MDIIADIEGAFARAEAHIKNLLDNGAPHQQPIARDLKTVLDHAKTGHGAPAADTAELDGLKAQVATLTTELADGGAKIANLQGNLDSLMAVRDSLQDQLDSATARITSLDAELVGATELQGEITAANAKIADLEAQLAAARSPLSVAAEPVGGRDAATGAQVEDANKTE